MESLTIRQPRPSDEGPIAELITAHFTPGSSYDVRLGLGDPSYHVRVATVDGAVVGTMALNLLSAPGAVADATYFFEDPGIVPGAERYGLLEMGYVREGFTGRGIGRRLLGAIETVGVEHGVELFLADAWYHGGADSPRRLLESGGYEIRHCEPVAWDDQCPKCDGECVCEGVLVARPA